MSEIKTFEMLSNAAGSSSGPPKLSSAKLSPSVQKLADQAKALYQEKLRPFVADHKPPAYVAKAPGRVNLIGEHTDYTGGYVLPLAIDRCTVAYGTGYVHTGKGSVATKLNLHVVSAQAKDDTVEERKISGNPPTPPGDTEERTWVDYVTGTVAQFMPDLPHEGCVIDLAIAFASDVPLGAGLSSSASLEVATAALVECFMHDSAYMSSDEPDLDRKVQRALRCQKAENEWAMSPCGIMDQLTSSCAKEGALVFIDCRDLMVTHVEMKKAADQPVILVCNSKVEHEIADSEYGNRRRECNDALEAMQEVPLYHVLSLRDANLGDVEKAKDKMEETTFLRAKHVVTENSRTAECKTALKLGLWKRVGELMDASHKSLKDDFDVSCEEINFLVDIAQKNDGVLGSRLTGGGFGGCTVTLVKKESVDEVIEQMTTTYKEIFQKDCECFVVSPGDGASVIAMDLDCKKQLNGCGH